MNAQTILPRLKAWFEDYICLFSSEDAIVQENVDLKKDHTLKVCETILDIGGSLDLSRDDLCIAEAAALLHDIGRFEQYKKYRTFSDYRSEDHAALGVRVIKDNQVLRGLEPVTYEIIVRLVGYHNRASLPEGL